MPTLVLHLGMGIWQHQKICTLDSLLASFRPPHGEMYLRYYWKYLLLGQDLKWAIHCNWPIPPRCRHLGSFWNHFTGVLSTSAGQKHQVTKAIETKMLGEQSQPTIETSWVQPLLRLPRGCLGSGVFCWQMAQYASKRTSRVGFITFAKLLCLTNMYWIPFDEQNTPPW